MNSEQTREALTDEIEAELHETRETDIATALARHEATLKAETLRWASEKLLEGIWPEDEEQGVKNAARELEARADLIESEARG